jgi:hypothetical protein
MTRSARRSRRVPDATRSCLRPRLAPRRGQGRRPPPRGDALPRARRRRRGDGRTLAAARGRAAARMRPPSCRPGGARVLDDEPDRASTSTRSRRRRGGPSRSRRVPDVVTRTLPDRPRGAARAERRRGRHVELDPALAERGVILCSLEEAFREHRELVERWYSKRLTIDRHKLEAANAAFWTAAPSCTCPRGVSSRSRLRSSTRSTAPGVAQYARTLVDGRAAASSAARVRPRRGLRGRGAARGRVRAVPGGRRALPPGAAQDWGPARCLDVSTRFVGVGRDAYCHWLPALLGGTSCAST